MEVSKESANFAVMNKHNFKTMHSNSITLHHIGCHIGRLLLSTIACMAFTTAVAQTQVIAHRGYWDTTGSAQNSLTSLRLAEKIGCYGSEFDVHLTSDHQIVVFHDDYVHGLPIQKTDYKTLKKYPLRNGESIPTLAKYLDAAKGLTTRLILEIKRQYSQSHEDSLVDATVAMVKAKGLADRTEYISFSKNACLRLRQLCPDAKIAFLGGDWDPQTSKDKGMTGIDYDQTVLARHIEWIKECHDLGLTVNVWTVNDLNAINDWIHAGVDFITTNKPVEAKKLARE